MNGQLLPIVTYIAFWVALHTIGISVLIIKDNRGRFSLAMMLVLMAAVAIICTSIALMLREPWSNNSPTH